MVPQTVPFHGDGNDSKNPKGHSGNHWKSIQEGAVKRKTHLPSVLPGICIPIVTVQGTGLEQTRSSALGNPPMGKRDVGFARKKMGPAAKILGKGFSFVMLNSQCNFFQFSEFLRFMCPHWLKAMAATNTELSCSGKKSPGCR